MSERPDPYRLAADAAAHLEEQLGRHEVAVVLGSGWAEVVDRLGETRAEVPLGSLPGAPAPTVPGHRGSLRSVAFDAPDGRSVPVLVAAGRVHLYEGHDAATVVHVVRAAVLSGCRTVVLTNAAGSLRPEVRTGTPVLVADHLNLTGDNPLCGPPPPSGTGSRFADLTDLYSARLRERIRAAVPDLGEGVYAGLRGGSFETPAEIRMLAGMGADLVGMSTVLEAIAAHHLGAAVVGVSLVTNLAAGLQASVDHEEVLAAGHASVDRVAEVLRAAVEAAVPPGPADEP